MIVLILQILVGANDVHCFGEVVVSRTLRTTKGGMRVSMSWKVAINTAILYVHVVAVHILFAKLWRVLIVDLRI